MKLARFNFNGSTTIGVVTNDRVIPLERLLPGAPGTTREVLA